MNRFFACVMYKSFVIHQKNQLVSCFSATEISAAGKSSWIIWYVHIPKVTCRLLLPALPLPSLCPRTYYATAMCLRSERSSVPPCSPITLQPHWDETLLMSCNNQLLPTQITQIRNITGTLPTEKSTLCLPVDSTDYSNLKCLEYIEACIYIQDVWHCACFLYILMSCSCINANILIL